MRVFECEASHALPHCSIGLAALGYISAASMTSLADAFIAAGFSAGPERLQALVAAARSADLLWP